MRPTVLATVGLLALAACEHPVSLSPAHVEAVDLVLRDSAAVEIARTEDNARWVGDSLMATVDSPLRLAVSLLDLEGEEFTLEGRNDVSIRVEARDSEAATWEYFSTYGLLHPNQTGATEVRFLVWHIDHPDFISPWIPLTIAPAGE